jgi:hypothetical protein
VRRGYRQVVAVRVFDAIGVIIRQDIISVYVRRIEHR